MIKLINKTLCYIFAILLLAALCGCAKKPEPLEMTEEEAKEVLRTLIPASEEINEIFYGEGLPYEDTGEKNIIFMPVAEDCKYKTESDIKKLAENVYSKAYLAGVYSMMFEGVKANDADGIVDFAADPRYKEIGGKLYVNVTYASYDLNTKYDIDTAAVSEKTADYIAVDISYTVGGKDMGKLTLKLVNQLGEWRLDTPTY